MNNASKLRDDMSSAKITSYLQFPVGIKVKQIATILCIYTHPPTDNNVSWLLSKWFLSARKLFIENQNKNAKQKRDDRSWVGLNHQPSG
jgi:hypothetical protein